MGSIPAHLAAELRDELGLVRGVETGTFLGDSARLLAQIFPSAVTIELSEQLWEDARTRVGHIPNLELHHGHSAEVLPRLVDPELPTFYFLDGHWSGGATAGEADECPVLAELNAIAGGHPNDCVVIDDARLFTAPPPPPHDASHWPTLLEIVDSLRAHRPDLHITVLDDQVIATPQAAKAAVDRFGQRVTAHPQPEPPLRERLARVARGGRRRSS